MEMFCSSCCKSEASSREVTMVTWKPFPTKSFMGTHFEDIISSCKLPYRTVSYATRITICRLLLGKCCFTMFRRFNIIANALESACQSRLHRPYRKKPNSFYQLVWEVDLRSLLSKKYNHCHCTSSSFSDLAHFIPSGSTDWFPTNCSWMLLLENEQKWSWFKDPRESHAILISKVLRAYKTCQVFWRLHYSSIFHSVWPTSHFF